MSVTASLARLRASNPSAPVRKSAPAQPRRDMAGLALNGLDTLSTIDPILPSLAPSLLLLPPYSDRATLSPDDAQAVSSAVISLASHLAPVFPLRPAQKIVSWLVHGLRVSQLGQEQEVDAVMLSALPFHATPHFVDLTVEVLRSPKWARWEWLRPVVKQKKPPSLEFVVRDCPDVVVRLAVAAAVEAVSAGVNTVAGAGFLANVLVRRLGTKGMTARRELLLAVVDALEKTNKLKVKDQVKSDLLCALMSAVAAAVPAGIEAEVASAAAQAVAMVIKSAEVKSAGSDTAAACLSLLVTRAGVTALGKDVARGLVKDDMLSKVLPRLRDEELIKSTYTAVILGLVTKPSVRMLGLVEKALANDNAALLSEESVGKVLARLLDMFIGITTDDGVAEEKQEAMRESFVSLLATLARGRFARGVDLALREHLTGRKKLKKSEQERYAFVDDAIGKALSGTAFEMVKEAVQKRSLPKGGTVLAMLAHPEPSVRKASLAKLLDAQYPWDEQDDGVTQIVMEKCFALLKDDPDSHVAADAAMCILRAASPQIPEDLLKSTFTRFRHAHSLLKKRKKRKKSRKDGVVALCTALLSVGERSLEGEPENVKAMFIGLIREGTFKEDSVFGGNGEIITRLKGLMFQDTALLDFCAVPAANKGLTDGVEGVLKSRFDDASWDCSVLLGALSVWEPAWVLDVLSLWLSHRDGPASKAEGTAWTSQVVKSMVALYEDHETVRNHVLEVAVKAVKPVCAALDSNPALSTTLDEIWDLVARGRDDDLAKRALREINKRCGLDDVRAMLHRSTALSRESHDRVRIFSLQWFLALCENDSADDVSRDAVLTLLCSLYGDDNTSREDAKLVCAARTVGRTTTTRNLPLGALYCAIGNGEVTGEVPTGPEAIASRPETLLRNALWSVRARVGYDASIISLGSSEEVVAVIRYAVGRITNQGCPLVERLYLLRAVEGFNGFNDDDFRILFQLEADLLPKLVKPDASTGVIAETVTRIALILTRMSTGTIVNKAIVAAVKATDTLLQSLQGESVSIQLQSREVLFALVAGAAHVFSLSETRKQRDRKHALLGHMLSFSTMSSSTGILAMEMLDQALDNSRLNDLVPFVESFSHKVGRKGKANEQHDEESRQCKAVRETGMGAVEALKRRLTSNEMSDSPLKLNTTSVATSLWAFVRTGTSQCSSDSTLAEGPEYELQNVLSLLALLYRREGQDGANDTPVDMDALMDAVFYPSPSLHGDESALMRSVREQALEVVEVLTPLHGEELSYRLRAVLDRQIQDKSFSGSLRSVQRLARVLLKSGCEFELLCNFLARAAYSEADDAMRTKENLPLIAACCMLMPDVELALVQCIQEISRQAGKYLDVSVIAKECSGLVIAVEQSVAADLSAIAKTDGALRCELALVHVLQPRFNAKLTETLRTKTSERDVVVAITGLLKSLWMSNGDSRDRPLAVLVTLLPLQALSSSFVDALSENDILLRLRVLRTLSERMEDDVPLMSTWNLEDGEAKDTRDLKSAEAMFVENVGTALCEVISECSKEGNTTDREHTSELTLLALACIQKIVDRVGSSAPQALLKLSVTPLGVLEDSRAASAISGEVFDETWGTYVAEALSCLSSFVTVIGKRAVTFIPRIVSISADILESRFGKDGAKDGTPRTMNSSFATMIEAALRICNTVVDNNAKFFGRTTLKRIAMLALSADETEVNELVLSAARKLPSSVTIGALATVSDNLAKSSASLTGVSTLLKSLSVVTEVVSKTELKVQRTRLVAAMLTCLEYGRFGSQRPVDVREEDEDANGTLSNGSFAELFNELLMSQGPQQFLSACQLVDESCAEAVAQLVLRISESEFKLVFNRVVQWLDGGRLGGDADSSRALDVPHNLVRAVPIFRISLSLMRRLQAIFVPYFVQILDQVVDVVSSKRPDGPAVAFQGPGSKQGKNANGKKRKRQEWEGDEAEAVSHVMVGLKNEMYEVALDNLVLFLSQELTSNIMTPMLVSKVQASLVSACGNEGKSEKIRRAFNALGMRIVGVGNMKESKEESRELLIALSRSILSLSGESDAEIREASVHYCKSLASTIGDEYLVTLPEAMPVLAELIDDENDAVRRETKAFVKVMETLSGESIMEEMKS